MTDVCGTRIFSSSRTDEKVIFFFLKKEYNYNKQHPLLQINSGFREARTQISQPEKIRSQSLFLPQLELQVSSGRQQVNVMRQDGPHAG